MAVANDVAEWAQAKGLESALLLLIEMHRPMVGLAGFATDFLLPFAPTVIGRVKTVIQDPQALEYLVTKLEGRNGN